MRSHQQAPAQQSKIALQAGQVFWRGWEGVGDGRVMRGARGVVEERWRSGEGVAVDAVGAVETDEVATFESGDGAKGGAGELLGFDVSIEKSDLCLVVVAKMGVAVEAFGGTGDAGVVSEIETFVEFCLGFELDSVGEDEDAGGAI